MREVNQVEVVAAFLPDGRPLGQRILVLMRLPEHHGLGRLEAVGTEMEGPVRRRIDEAPVHVVVDPIGIVNAISGLKQCVRKFFWQCHAQEHAEFVVS
jgi:hypothetical protein